MARERRFRGTARYIAARRTAYALLYGGIIGALLFVGLSLLQAWYGFIPMATAAILILGYLLVGSVWAAHRIYDRDGLRPGQVLYRLSQINPEDRVVCIDLGLRVTPIEIAPHLTGGQVVVVDVYNPQATPGATLRRARSQAPPTIADPRLVWIDSDIGLLPMPNNSVPAVFMNEILSAFALPEDRTKLLREVHRILIENGRLLVAERVRSPAALLLSGPVALSQAPAEHWRALLRETGFAVRREEDLQGLVHCYRADKPSPAEGRQLALRLELP